MTDAALLQVVREGLYLSLLVSLPVLAVSLIVGLIVGIIQAATQIQEGTLFLRAPPRRGAADHRAGRRMDGVTDPALHVQPLADHGLRSASEGGGSAIVHQAHRRPSPAVSRLTNRRISSAYPLSL